MPFYLNNELIGLPSFGFTFNVTPYKEQKIMIGSDGLEDLLSAMEKGLISEYKNLAEFMQDEQNYSDPSHLPRFPTAVCEK